MTTATEELVAAANAPLKDADMTVVTGPEPRRFELYHFALSLCSQKVRYCLVEKNAGFVAHDLNVDLPLLGNYDPSYVRLRLAAAPGARFATGYTGRSSVRTEGFDPAVVPTLVDHVEGRVIADSVEICRHIDRVVAPARALMPDDVAGDVEAEIAIVDATPQVALLYGAYPDEDFRPARLQRNMPGVHDRKIAKIRAARDSVRGDADLVAAYDAKIEKEEAGRSFVGSPEKMRAALDEVLTSVGGLDTRLADGRKHVCGDRLTLADLFWTVSLFRLKWLGMGFAWEGGHALKSERLVNVSAYVAEHFRRPSFRRSCIDWPKTPRSEFVTEYYSEAG